MSKLLRSLSFLSLLLSVFLVSSPASAQMPGPWTNVYTAPSIITVVKFLDKEGAGTNGFVGYPAGISYTVNGGGTWTAATVPTFTGTVTSFAFASPQVGFAGVINNSTLSGLLVTVDGGVTWKFDDVAPHEINGLYWHKSDHKLFIASATDSAAWTTDSGKTFTAFADFPFTGFTFNSDAKGIMSNVNGNMGQNTSYLFTTNGGVTWLKTNMFNDGWQPVGLEQTNTYFVTDPLNNIMLRSDNGGVTWFPVTSFTSVSPTGSMDGNACALVATAGDGVWISIDGGLGWQPLPFSPLSTKLTRFYVSPTKIYAAQGKTLQSQGITMQLPIHLFPPALTYSTGGCFTADTTLRFYTCVCSSFQLSGVSLAGTNGTPAPSTYTLQAGQLPRPTCGLDSVHLQYTAGSAPDTVLVIYHLMENSTPVDDTVYVYGPGQPINITANTTRLVAYNRKGCESVDTSITLSNNLCNTLTITGLSIDDPSHIQILNGALPITLNARGSYRLPIHMQALTKGTYNAEITVTVTTPTGSKQIKVFVTLLVSRSVTPQVSQLKWTIFSPCQEHDTTITYTNNLCDSIFFSNIFLQKGSAGPFQVGGPTTLKLGPGDSYSFPVHIVPTTQGTYTDKVTFQATIQGEDITVVDTLIVTIQNNIVVQASATPAGAVFGATSLCDSTREISIVLKNIQCVPLTISAIGYNLPNDSTFRLTSGPAINRVMQPGEFDSIRVHFYPGKYVNGDQGSIQITYKYGATTKSVILPVTGFGSSKVTASLSQSALAFDTLKFCESKQLTTQLRNGPCGPIQISQINVLSGSGFTVTTPKVGDQIPSGGTAPVTINFIPTASGPQSGKVELVISDLSGNTGISDTVTFAAVVTAPIRKYAVSSIAATSLRACDTRNTTITLTNNGQCDTMKITALSPATGSVVATVNNGIALPHNLLVGETMTFNVLFNPNNVVADLTGNVIISASPDISIPYNIPVTSCGVVTPGKLSVDVPDSVFNTKNCTILTKTYTLSNTGNQDIQITGLSIGTGSKFLLTNSTTLPATLKPGEKITFTVDFNPDATGFSNTQLTITSPTNGYGTRTIPLTGTATGAPKNANIGLTGPANQNTVSLAPDLTNATDFPIILRDPIDVALGLKTAHFFINYNQDVLTEKSVNPASGWSLVSATSKPTGLDVIMNYTGSTSIAAGTQIATVSMFVTLADASNTTLTISQTHFNESDPNFERCKLSLSSAGDVVTVNTIMGCTDSIAQRALRGQPIVSGFLIRPNPVHRTGTEIEVAFGLSQTADTKIEVIDLNGKRMASYASRQIEAGSYSVTIPSSNLAEGVYFVQLTTNNQVITRKIIVERQ